MCRSCGRYSANSWRIFDNESRLNGWISRIPQRLMIACLAYRLTISNSATRTTKQSTFPVSGLMKSGSVSSGVLPLPRYGNVSLILLLPGKAPPRTGRCVEFPECAQELSLFASLSLPQHPLFLWNHLKAGGTKNEQIFWQVIGELLPESVEGRPAEWIHEAHTPVINDRHASVI